MALRQPSLPVKPAPIPVPGTIANLVAEDKAKLGRMVEELLTLRKTLQAEKSSRRALEARVASQDAELERLANLVQVDSQVCSQLQTECTNLQSQVAHSQARLLECSRLLRMAELKIEAQDEQVPPALPVA